MGKQMRFNRNRLSVAGVSAIFFGVTMASIAPPIAPNENSDATTSDVQSKLNKSEFKDVKVSVDNGIATLSGTVDLYEYKVNADKRTHKVKGVEAVRNDIQVAGPSVSDQELKSKLGDKLAYDRVGYGNTFNAITLGSKTAL